MVCNKPEWLTDPRFETLPLRMQNIDVLEAEIEAILTTKPTAHWVELLDAAEVPAGPVYRYEQTLNDPHVRARNMVVDIDHPIIGPMKTLGLPIKSSGDLTAIRKPAPWLGQHSEEVLRGIGYADADIADLFAAKVVFDRQRAGERSKAQGRQA
jgi:crotonobetainyl-CoA:carnitine CoA-transferase CaiB-like acyl-CoA transferase